MNQREAENHECPPKPDYSNRVQVAAWTMWVQEQGEVPWTNVSREFYCGRAEKVLEVADGIDT